MNTNEVTFSIRLVLGHNIYNTWQYSNVCHSLFDVDLELTWLVKPDRIVANQFTILFTFNLKKPKRNRKVPLLLLGKNVVDIFLQIR